MVQARLGGATREFAHVREFIATCGERHKDYPLAFGLADSPPNRYSVVITLHEVRRCKRKIRKGIVAAVLFYVFDGNQLIDTPVARCFVRFESSCSFIRLQKIVMAFCYIVSHGTVPQELRDLEFSDIDVLEWEKSQDEDVADSEE